MWQAPKMLHEGSFYGSCNCRATDAAKATKVPLIFNTISNCVSVNNSKHTLTVRERERAATTTVTTTMITNKIDNKSNAHVRQ